MNPTEHNTGSSWNQYLDSKDREKLRLPTRWVPWLPSIPWAGEVLDKIDHCRSELESLSKEIARHQARPEIQPSSGSALIQFNHPIGAHMACQSLQHVRPHIMIISQIGGSPDSILWECISMRWWERYFRAFIVGGTIGVLIILCTVPVAFTGLLSQINYLIIVFPSLSWLQKLPVSTIAMLQEVLPICLLATVMILLLTILYRLLLTQGSHFHVTIEV